MTRKGEAVTLSVSKHQRDRLEALAAELRMLWGGKPSISQLVKAIADQKLRVAANHDWSAARITELHQAWRSLRDAGQLDAAMGVAQLLLERHETALPLRQELEAFVLRPGKPWRSQLEALLRKQQPFELAYQDASERVWEFTVRHAKIITHEKREYLDCYCDETEGNKDLPALRHNWCFRLDRIPDVASLNLVKARWVSELPTIEVELHLFNGLAFSYEAKQMPKQPDLRVEWHGKLPRVRRVVRAVSSTFWLFREVRCYGPDCEVVGPEQVRERFVAEQRSLMALYG